MPKKKRRTWGGKREGSGRKKDKHVKPVSELRTVKKGVRLKEDEEKLILAAMTKRGVASFSLYVVNASVNAARKDLEDENENV